MKTTIGKVYDDNCYAHFKLKDGNRDIRLSAVKKISNSMRNNGWLGSPISVNKSMEILDGQHRWMAAKRAGIPVRYIIVDDMDVEQIREINSAQTKWKQSDIIKSKADTGDVNYRYVLQLLKAYTGKKKVLVTNIVVAAILHNYEASSLHSLGNDFKFSENEYEQCCETLDYISKCVTAYMEGSLSKTKGRIDYFAKAVLFMIDHGADRDRLLAKISKRATKFQAVGNTYDALIQLEGIYNWKVSPDETVLFKSSYDQYKLQQRANAQKKKETNVK